MGLRTRDNAAVTGLTGLILDCTGTGRYWHRTVRVRDGYGTVRVRFGTGDGTDIGRNDGTGSGLRERDGYGTERVRICPYGTGTGFD